MLLAGDQIDKHPPGKNGALVEREQERLHLLERSAAHVTLDVFNHRLVLLAEGELDCGADLPVGLIAIEREVARRTPEIDRRVLILRGEDVRAPLCDAALAAAAYQQLVRYMTAPTYRFVRVLPHPGSRPDAERLHEATHVLEVDLAKPTGGVNLLDLLERQIRAQRVWEVISPSPKSTAGER